MHPLRHTRIPYKILDGKKLRAFASFHGRSHTYTYIYTTPIFTSFLNNQIHTYVYIFVTEYKVQMKFYL